MIKVGINGFGRIGRLVFREIITSTDFDVVVVNAPSKAEDLSYLLKYDTTHRSFHPEKINFEEDYIIINDTKKVKTYHYREPEKIPWSEHSVDLVIDTTGVFTTKEDLSKHFIGGAKKVLLSAPGKEIKSIVYSVNESEISNDDNIVSASSCTTNALAPLIKLINDNYIIKNGYMLTVHAFTNDQNTLDGGHKDPRRGRAAAANIVPNTTGAAKAIGLVIPELAGKLDGAAQRVPVITGSLVELFSVLNTNVTVEEINAAMKDAADESYGYTEDPIVSSDIIGELHGSIFDATQTKIMEVDGKQLVKTVAWYDNETSFTANMLRTAKYLTNN